MLGGRGETILFVFFLIDYVCNDILELPTGLGIMASIFVVLVVFFHSSVCLMEDGVWPLWEFVVFFNIRRMLALASQNGG